MCMEKDPQLPASGEIVWDWERLIVHLGQVDVFEPGGRMHRGVPPGLRNRRRIWRMLFELGKPVSAVTASTQAGAPGSPVAASTEAGVPSNTIAASTQVGAPAITIAASTQAGVPANTVAVGSQVEGPVNTVPASTQAGEATNDGDIS